MLCWRVQHGLVKGRQGTSGGLYHYQQWVDGLQELTHIHKEYSVSVCNHGENQTYKARPLHFWPHYKFVPNTKDGVIETKKYF